MRRHADPRHARSYGHDELVYDPLHYLALLETKPGALDQAAALQGWALPPAFQHLRHLLEARMGNRAPLPGKVVNSPIVPAMDPLDSTAQLGQAADEWRRLMRMVI